MRGGRLEGWGRPPSLLPPISGLTRDRQILLHKSAKADLCVRDATLRVAPHHEGSRSTARREAAISAFLPCLLGVKKPACPPPPHPTPPHCARSPSSRTPGRSKKRARSSRGSSASRRPR